MFQNRNILFFLLFTVSVLNSQTRVKTMFYNLLRYDSNIESQNRTTHLKTVLNEIQPDLFMVCELQSKAASDYLFTNAVKAYNINFEKATYKESESPATDLLQMVYYNNQKLTLLSNKVIPTNIRDINHYTFKLNTQNETKIEVFVTHFKASRGEENRQKRRESAEIFARSLDDLPTDANVIFAGDFNFYTSNESGFQLIIQEQNNINIIDPINRLCPEFPNDGKDYYDVNYDRTYFWNNSSFADVHSQSTRTTPLTDGSGGGMDDRFDFILLSKNFTTSSELYYINNSYKTIGNNANCYNSFVSNTSCSGEYSQNLRNALFNFSDHLPIVLDIESQQNVLNISNYTLKEFEYTLVDNILKLKIDSNITDLKIYNTLGQLVFNRKQLNSKEKVINIESLKNGVYMLKIDNFKPLKFLKH